MIKVSNELKFPIFAFGKTDQKHMIGEENMIYVIHDISTFNTTKLRILKSDYFINQEIIDCNGCVCWVKKVNFVRFDGFGKYFPFLGDSRKIIVNFGYQEKQENITLDNFKNRIIPMVENMKDIWEEAYGDIEDLKKLIIDSKSFEEVAGLLG